jgi:HSP20 family protein
MTQQHRPESMPVRVYTAENRIMVAAPMPGLEPGDISVVIADNRVTIHGAERGPRQHGRNLLLAEWAVGPYYRQIDLPQPVNGPLANATYGNGVLVLALPTLAPGQPSVPAQFTLEVITATHGEHVGHTGRAQHPTTTQEHRQKMAETARNAGAAQDRHVPK